MSEKNYILSTLLYFDIFKYPLTLKEIQRFLKIEMDLDKLNLILKTLIAEGKVFQEKDDCFTVRKNESLYLLRQNSNKLAKAHNYIAQKNGRLIASFPFVRAVCLSGSFSKGVMFHDSDIDYFIITAKNRLWICRAFLVLYKKIFLLNSKKRFCINYFISEEHLKIKEENIFTATEICTLMPVSGSELFDKFLNSNSWTKSFMINNHLQDRSLLKDKKQGILAMILEKIFEVRIFDFAEKRIMKYFQDRNDKKYFYLKNHANYELMFKSGKERAKIHKLDHQGKVLSLFTERLERYIDSDEILSYAREI